MKERLAILEENKYGLIVLNITKKAKQFITIEKLNKRINWGMYELVNACLVPAYIIAQ